MRKIIILIMVILPLVLVAQTEWIVIPSGGGDFTTISAAIASPSVEDGDIITCYEATYTENITISKEIFLRSRGPNYITSTILDGSQNPTGTILTVNANLSDVVIQGFTIQSNTINSGTGVLIHNSDVLLTGNVIRNIKWGIHLNDSMVPNQTPVIDNNEVYGTYIGIYCNSPLMPLIENNVIYSNSNSGLYFYGDNSGSEETVTIKENRIYNHSNGNAKAIFSQNVDLIIDSNIIFDNIFAFCHGSQTSHSVNISRSTIYNNNYFMNMQYNTLNITNSIIWDNGEFLYNPPAPPPPLPPYMPYTINYSCLQYTSVHYNGGNGVVSEEDPLFIDENNHNFGLKWTSTEKSPCIDTGDPNSPNDPDDTRTDMGAIYCEHEVKTYTLEGQNGSHDGITWLSFDVLDIFQATTANQVQNLFDLIKDDLNHGEHENIWFEYEEPNWQNGEHLIISPNGYIVQMVNQGQIDISGFRCEPTTTFPVYAEEENWIGYFLDYTQHVYDAFEGRLENIYSIRHQEWSIDGSHGWPDVNYTLSPGDMVIVECETDIPTFSWVSDTPSEAFEIQEVQQFSFTEEVDYIPIYVLLDEEDMPDEIAVFVDGNCEGAKVVQNPLVDVLAYITDIQSGCIELEFAYYGRETNKHFTNYSVIDPASGIQETTVIDLSKGKDHYYVSFRNNDNSNNNLPTNVSVSNYPNPFNPTTSILYELPSDGKIVLSVYNLKGQKVRELVNGITNAGKYSVVWDGKDDTGKHVSSGIYYYRITSCGKTLNKKMLMLK